MATENTTGVIMPCETARNFGEDTAHAGALARQFGIATQTIDLTPAAQAMKAALPPLPEMAAANIAPRLRMTALYAIAHAGNLLVAGTGNRSEIHLGYFTKFGDGACDINPIADLTVTEVLAFLRHLNAPAEITDKPPSAGLFEGQTDEKELGMPYAEIDSYIMGGSSVFADKIDKIHTATEHKRRMPLFYGG
jgi:NAD+ synthase